MNENTQHPLTDEARDRLTAYIAHGTIDCSSEEGRYDSLTEDDARRIIDSLWGPMTEAAFDAGREYEREHAAQDRPAEITDEMVEKALNVWFFHAEGAPFGELDGYPSQSVRGMRAALSAALAVTAAEPLARTLLGVPEGYGAPHHDAKEIKAGDFVVQVDRDGEVRADIAHYQDKKGDWFMEDGRVITWVGYRADRPDALTVWPAPAPPADEVEMPNEFGAVITDVEDWNGETYDRLAFLGLAFEDSVDKVHPDELAAFTLPDGTRARRDGDHANGEPRFVKTQEEEK